LKLLPALEDVLAKEIHSKKPGTFESKTLFKRIEFLKILDESHVMHGGTKKPFPFIPISLTTSLPPCPLYLHLFETGSCYAAQGDLKLDGSASVSEVLGLQVCTATLHILNFL
jgi:hypothetical protein